MQDQKYVTLLECAIARGAVQDKNGRISGEEFERVRIPLIGGCEVCGATVAAYNAGPSKSGFIRCMELCIGNEGFESIEAFEKWAQPDAIEEQRAAASMTVEELRAVWVEHDSIDDFNTAIFHEPPPLFIQRKCFGCGRTQEPFKVGWSEIARQVERGEPFPQSLDSTACEKCEEADDDEG